MKEEVQRKEGVEEDEEEKEGREKEKRQERNLEGKSVGILERRGFEKVF